MSAKSFFKDLTSNIVLLDTKEKNCNFRFFIESKEDYGRINIDLIVDNCLAFTIKCKINFDEKPTLEIIAIQKVKNATKKAIKVANNVIAEVHETFDDIMHIYEV